MKTYLSNLNPTERRFVIGAGLLLFIVVNVFWVRPHFSDWGDLKLRLEKSQLQLRTYDRAIQQTNTLAGQIQKLSSEEAAVPPEDQSVQFFQAIQRQVAESRVGFQGSGRMSMRTNEFFIEQEQPINIQGDEKQLVDFLYKLGAGSSLIRVKSLSLNPADLNRQQLRANITLVASYQKKSRSATAAARGSAPRSGTPAPRAGTPAPRSASPAAKQPASNRQSQPNRK